MKIIQLTPLSKPIKASVNIPGSKSYTNRALFIAAMASGPVKILNPLISDDTRAMIDCLRTLGIMISERGNYIEVKSNLSAVTNRRYKLDAKLSGLTIRFLTSLSAIIPGNKIIYGKEGLNKRPIKELVSALTQLGAKIEYIEKNGFPPIKITSSTLASGRVKMNGSISSQYFSALLMIAPVIGGLALEVKGKQTSKPFIDMTIDIMNHFGVKVSNKDYREYIVKSKQNYSNKKYIVEGDISSASYFLAIAALTKSTISLKNINPKSKQADMKFIQILESMGNQINYGKNEMTIVGKGLKATSIDMNDCPDQIQTLAVLAAFVKGVTKIAGIANLRLKETNRIFAVKEELKRMGIKTSATKDVLIIHGGNPKSATIRTYGDHRMSMAFAVAGTKLAGIKIVDPDVVNKTFPNFWNLLNSIGVKMKKIDENIVLIGMRGSGKTTVGKLVARNLKRKYVEVDQLIAQEVGLSIPKIIDEYGWDFFRDKEAAIIKKVSLERGIIISTGGGVILKQENIDALKKNGSCILLNASVATLVKRLKNYSNRPPLTNKKTPKEELELLLKQRRKLYLEAADKIIETDNLNPKQIAAMIIPKPGDYNQ